MGVYLREKKLSGGEVSYYLDIYHNKSRWYEFLEIKVNKRKPTEQDKEKKRLAQEIRARRENELIVQHNGLVDKSQKKANFITWYENHLQKHPKNSNHFRTTLWHLKNYMGRQPLPFTAITAQWIREFTSYLLARVSNNTTRCYLMDVFTMLEDAIRQDIIPSNPFRKIERHERIRQQDVFRIALTLEQLQQLADTPCKINPQVKQAYFFSCFTGLRWSDVNPLRWSEVIQKNIDGQTEWFIYFEQEKTEDIEYLPLSEQAVEILQQRKEQARKDGDNSPYVFPFIKEVESKSLLRYQKATRDLKKWSKEAGLGIQLTFHTGRHTFATNVLENSPDGDLWTVSKLLGHKSIKSTQIYAHVRDRKKAAAVKSLPRLNFPSGKVA